MLFVIIIAFEKTDVIGCNRMVIFPFGIHDTSQRTAVGYTFHFSVENHVRVILGKHIN